MAKKLDPRLLEILTTYGERPEDALWDCHGTWVAYHAAVERIAAKAGVRFDHPEMIVNDPAAKTVVIRVTGKIVKDGQPVLWEWSFGEVSPANNKNSYPYSMAEKRAKDRVTLKLVGMHGLAYSEEESDDFKPQPAPLRDGLKTNKQTGRTSANSLKQDKSPDNWDAFLVELDEVQSVAGLTKFAMAWSHISTRDVWPTSWHELAKEKINNKREELVNGVVSDDDTFPGDLPPRERSVLEAG